MLTRTLRSPQTITLLYIDHVHDIDPVNVPIRALPAKQSDQKVRQVSSAIGCRISPCKRNTILKDRCINLHFFFQFQSLLLNIYAEDES